jgi:hypothetical protein
MQLEPFGDLVRTLAVGSQVYFDDVEPARGTAATGARLAAS